MKTQKLLFYLLFIGMLFQAKAVTTNVTPETIAEAMTAASDGDTLLLAAGTYSSGIQFKHNKVLTLKADGSGTVTITQEVGAENGATTDNTGLVFIGVTIDRGNAYFLKSDMMNIKMIAFYQDTIKNINRCLLRTDATSKGYEIDSIIIENCIMKDNGEKDYRFIVPSHFVKSIKVTNSTFMNYLGGESFYYANCDANTEFVHSFQFENNTVYRASKPGNRAICKVESKYSVNSNYTFRNNIFNKPGDNISEPGVPNPDTTYVLNATGGNLIAENNLIVEFNSYKHNSPMSSTINDLTLEGLGIASIGFADPDNGDLSIGYFSPLQTAGTDGGPIGDPRWMITEAPLGSPATDITLSSSSVDENAATGIVIGTLSSTDPDEGDTHTYSIISGADFDIDGTNLIALVSFDFEMKSSASVTIRTKDNNDLTFDKQFTISINDLNDAPTAMTIDDTTVAENSAVGTVVGAFTTTDVDAGDSYTYSIVGESASFDIDGANLITKESFDYESQDSYTVSVKSTDSGGLTVERTFTILVKDVIEKPALGLYDVTEISVYPNPSSDVINVRGFENIEMIKITDLSGKLIWSGVDTKIDVQSIDQGIYLLEIKGQNGHEFIRFIKD